MTGPPAGGGARVLLFTGKGGVGKTSVAVATALRAAGRGQRTLLMSTDPAHSVGDALDIEVGAEPKDVAPNLTVHQVDARRRLEENWRRIQSYLVALLSWGGVGEIEAEELAVVPGVEEVFSLIDVRRHVEAGRHDLVVVDCAPTAETLRLLSLPDALGWYMERVFPLERKLARAVRPVLGRLTSMPLPDDGILDAVADLYADLDGVRDILSDGTRTSVRLVVNAERVVIAEARRTYTYLQLFGYHVDAVVANRLLPPEVIDPYLARWKDLQAEHLRTVEDGFAGLPVLTAPLFDDELVGAPALQRLGEALYDGQCETDVLASDAPLRFEHDGDDWVLDLALPFVTRTEVDLHHRGDELYIRVDGHNRSLLLPAALRRYDVAGAELADGRLAVRFVPLDPAAPAPAHRPR